MGGGGGGGAEEKIISQKNLNNVDGCLYRPGNNTWHRVVDVAVSTAVVLHAYNTPSN